MTDQLPLRLIWHERATVAEIRQQLHRAQQIEITLPADYNHALFRALNPSAPAGAVERLDTRGGPELLAQIATVPGLEALAGLTGMLDAAGAALHILSPPTLVIDLPTAHRAQA